MPGQTPEAAFSDFAKPVRAALRCLDSAAELHDRRFHESSTYLLKTAADGLSFGPRGDEYVLHVSLRLALVKGGPGRRRYRMSTRRYAHEIWRAGSSERLMGWHWHPDSKTSPFRYPHIHFPPGAAMSTKHMPSGRISVEAIVRFAIEELDARPANNCWESLLDSSEAIHKKHRTWD